MTDHIETLCEIDIEYRAVAQKLGIEDFRMSRAIENHPSFIRALADSIESSLGNPKILPERHNVNPSLMGSLTAHEER